MVPVQVPDTIFSRKVFLSWSLPHSRIASIAPCVSSGQSENAMFAEVIISVTGVDTSLGRPCPPHSGSSGRPFQPPSTNWRYASRKPLGVRTEPSFHCEPSWSPE